MIEQSCFANLAERFGIRQIRRLIGSPNADVLAAASAGGDIVGWAAGLVRRSGRGLTGRIYALAVGPEARGLSLGRLLMRREIALLKTRGAGRIFLEVREDNVAAIRLYLALGFVDRCVRLHYYGRGLHAKSMLLVI